MVMLIIILLFFMVSMSFTTLTLQRKHLLMALLSLECVTLTLALFLFMLSGLSAHMSPFLLILFLTFGAVEASLGLSLLVSMTRSFGSDNIKSMSLLSC